MKTHNRPNGRPMTSCMNPKKLTVRRSPLHQLRCVQWYVRGVRRCDAIVWTLLASLLAACFVDLPHYVGHDADPVDAAPDVPDAGTCIPDSVVCTDDRYIDCSSTGTVEVQLDCVLGCDATEAKCRDVDPSNGVASYLDQAHTDPLAPVLTLAAGSTIDTTTGVVFDGSATVTVPNAGVGTNRVFIVKSLAITGTVVVTGTAGLIIVSDGDVGIAATLDVSANAGANGPGGGSGSCDGGWSTTASSAFSGGGGGGGNGDVGGVGGVGDGTSAGGTGGPTLSDQALDPLRGGCQGGRATETTSTCRSGRGGGGGAVQLVSRSSISITGSGTIDASGGGGVPAVAGTDTCSSTSARGGGGGGAGGSVLLEALEIVLMGAGVIISTNGGGGSAGGVTTLALFGADGGTQAGRAAGGVNATTGANGGGGGTVILTPENGVSGGASEDGGGGGGAVGRARFNTLSGTVTPMGGAVIRSKSSNGALGIRLVP